MSRYSVKKCTLLFSFLTLNACASVTTGVFPARVPYVQPSHAALAVMADNAFALLRNAYKAGPTVWSVRQPISDEFGEQLLSKFQADGYGLEYYNEKGLYDAGTIPLKYVVDNLLSSYPIMWRVKLCAGDEVLSRAFVETSPRTAGRPSPIGQWVSVKEACE